MGREWSLTGGRFSVSSSSSSVSSSSSSSAPRNSNLKSQRRRRGGSKENSSSSSSPPSSARAAGGCMSAVFQLFDLHHHLHFPLQHQSSFKFHLHDEEPSGATAVTKGTEAPRNSLELEHYHPPLPFSESSNLIRKDAHLLTPSMGIQIKTSRTGQSSNVASSPEISSSPAAKTPTLVARLMGLDVLPDSTSSSPRPSSTLDSAPSARHSHTSRTPHHIRLSTGRKSCSDVDLGYKSRSLPETPRMSLQARRSDVDHHHRPLSLRNNTENAGSVGLGGEEFDFSRLRIRELKRSSEEGTARSPSHYARQIVKQVKESVSRRVGLIDITNTIRSQSSSEQMPKPKPPPRKPRLLAQDSGLSCSPRMSSIPETAHCTAHYAGEATRTKPPQCDHHNAAQKLPSCKISAASSEFERAGRSTSITTSTAAKDQFMDVRIRQGQPMAYIRASKTTGSNHKSNDNYAENKCNSTSCRTRKRTTAPNAAAAAAILPVKKDPSPPATKIPQKQVHDIQTSKHSTERPVGTSHRCRYEAAKLCPVRDEKVSTSKHGSTKTVAAATIRQAESQYVSNILRAAGIETDTRLSSFAGWFSPSHPLDPSIFAFGTDRISLLENHCDQKLVFELVDELLADLLKPNFLNLKPWLGNMSQSCSGSIRIINTGAQLFNKLQARIESFPRADCHVLEDIDAIIDCDLPKSEVWRLRALEEEGDGVVSELERAIWDDLVREVVDDEFGLGPLARNGVVR